MKIPEMQKRRNVNLITWTVFAQKFITTSKVSKSTLCMNVQTFYFGERCAQIFGDGDECCPVDTKCFQTRGPIEGRNLIQISNRFQDSKKVEYLLLMFSFLNEN